jgi:hypothetical protein
LPPLTPMNTGAWLVERGLDLGRGRHIEPGQRHLIGEEVGLPA